VNDAVAESLERFAALAGDPNILVSDAMFARWPESAALFVMDRGGQVRGQMLAIAFEALLDGGARLAGLIGIERMNHVNIGVDAAMFDGFFNLLRELVRQTLGAEWTPAMEAGWRDRLATLS
jgi:acetyl-CoA acetyltransferase